MPHAEAAADLPRSVALVGAGKMGGAMLEGWLAAGLDPAGVTVVEPKPSPELIRLRETRPFRLNPPPGEVTPPQALVLATKPQSLDEAAAGANALIGPGTLVVSVLAGKTVANLRARLPGARAVARAMPNLPASIGRGATGVYASPETAPAQRAMAHALLATSGHVEWLEDERLIDAVTALSGSGPAYVFHLVECMARAGAAVGLPADVAERLARATVAGSGALLAESPLPAATLRENVTSPAGTTAAALGVLWTEPSLADLMARAIAAARRRAEELSG